MVAPNVKTKIIKAGYILIIIAAMIAFTRVSITDSSPSVEGNSYDVQPNSQEVDVTLWSTRNIRLILDISPATARINIYLLDEQGIKTLHDEQILNPVLTLDNVDGCDLTYEPPYRGIYAIVIKNISNQTAKISQRVISQGLEWDILQFSAIVAAIGVALSLLPRFRHAKEHTNPPRPEKHIEADTS
jgi:hypothetical protein